MDRFNSTLAWGLLATSLVVPLGCTCLSGIFLLGLVGPDPETVLAKAQPVGERIAAALDEFHRRHGRYPQ